MKIASFIATALLAVSAFAGQVVYHDYDGALRGIALNNACITATEVKSITSTRNCVKLVPVTSQQGENTVTDWVCQKWETAQVSYPRAFSRTVCAKYAYQNDNLVCEQFVQKSEFLPATIKVSVVTDQGDNSNFPGVSHLHTFPACK